MTAAVVSPGLRLAQARAFVWRFQTLALANHVLAPGPWQLLQRPLFGFQLIVDVTRSNVQRLLILEGERFVAERRLVAGLLRSGMTVVDVGANIGYYVLLFEQHVGPTGRLVCFEPEPSNLVELRRNVSTNGLTNVTIVPAAVGAAAGEVVIRFGINAAIADGDVTANSLHVPLVALDQAITSRVDFLKIDVEGYEAQVIAGATRILEQHRPTLFLEIHPGFLTPPSTVDGILDSLSAWYPSSEFCEIAPQASLPAKVAARYLGGGVHRIRDRAGLLEQCRIGARNEPFWAICRAARQRS